jgi:uncharacterized membrane protein
MGTRHSGRDLRHAQDNNIQITKDSSVLKEYMHLRIRVTIDVNIILGSTAPIHLSSVMGNGALGNIKYAVIRITHQVMPAVSLGTVAERLIEILLQTWAGFAAPVGGDSIALFATWHFADSYRVRSRCLQESRSKSFYDFAGLEDRVVVLVS